MTELAKLLAMLIDSANVLWIAIALFVAIAFNINKILEFIESRRKRKAKLLREVVECPHSDEATRHFLKKELQRENFLLATGIQAEEPHRIKIIETINESNGVLPLFHFSRASQFIKYRTETNKLEVEISPFDKFAFIFNLTIGALLGLAGLFLFLSPLIQDNPKILQMLATYGVALFAVCTGIAMAFQTFPFLSASKIRKHLEERL